MDGDGDIQKSGHFFFDPEDPIYREHFPGFPVVPGSLIIHAFTKALGKAHNLARATAISNFRFKHFVSPGRYAYRMTPKSDGRVACVLYDQEKIVVTGTL